MSAFQLYRSYECFGDSRDPCIQMNIACPTVECAFEVQDLMDMALEESYLPLENCALKQPNLVASNDLTLGLVFSDCEDTQLL